MEDKKEINEQIRKLLENKLIEESCSPFATPVHWYLKKKKIKKSRLCIDFRDLNKIVVPEAQPFPLIEDLMEEEKIDILGMFGHQRSSAILAVLADWKIIYSLFRPQTTRKYEFEIENR